MLLDLQVLKEQKVLLVLLDNLDNPVLVVALERLDSRVLQVYPVQLGVREQREDLEVQERLDS